MIRRLAESRLAVAVAAAALTLLGVQLYDAATRPSGPPACARQSNAPSMGQLADCARKVDAWCAATYPTDTACPTKVFGYDPDPLGRL